MVSAPLILGLDLADEASLAAIVPTITNAEALQVSQNWAGHPGRLVWQGLGGALGFPAARACDPSNPGLKQFVHRRLKVGRSLDIIYTIDFAGLLRYADCLHRAADRPELSEPG